MIKTFLTKEVLSKAFDLIFKEGFKTVMLVVCAAIFCYYDYQGRQETRIEFQYMKAKITRLEEKNDKIMFEYNTKNLTTLDRNTIALTKVEELLLSQK